MELRPLLLQRWKESQMGEGSCPKSHSGRPGKKQPLAIVELIVNECFTSKTHCSPSSPLWLPQWLIPELHPGSKYETHQGQGWGG